MYHSLGLIQDLQLLSLGLQRKQILLTTYPKALLRQYYLLALKYRLELA